MKKEKPADVVNPAVVAEYGEEAVREIERKKWQIVTLTREQMDSDALLELFDNEPTYNRSNDFKQRLSTAATARPAENNTPAESGNKTINFG